MANTLATIAINNKEIFFIEIMNKKMNIVCLKKDNLFRIKLFYVPILALIPIKIKPKIDYFATYGDDLRLINVNTSANL